MSSAWHLTKRRLSALSMDHAADAHSGITLVLPSLRALKAANAGAKHPPNPRPVKLKPLRQVLSKLIAQLKKKDDYAFFIHPVDPAHVPGYAAAIPHPMDFGTMAAKVSKGKYRSLDDFASDFRLVVSNAKTFNPPGSIYYTEADRIEAWGLDHIARAAAHVIECETHWNIDVEQEDDIDDDVSTPRDRDGSLAAASPAPSATPAPPPLAPGKRGPRGPYKKHHVQTAPSESLDAERKLPGAKDGVGAFPPGSDWAELMLALKIKGKRYKTKKERLRFEREGPPYLPDASLNYAEMEDPFSVLNVFVPDPPARPQVTPLYPPADPTQPRIRTPVPITIPPNRPPPVLSTIPSHSSRITSDPNSALRPPRKRRHWTIVRNVPARSRLKDKDDPTVDDAKTAWKAPQDAGPADYGSFAAFLGDLAASALSPGAGMGAAEYVYGSEHRLFATIRSTVEHRGIKRKRDDDVHAGNGAAAFWTDERADEGWDYLRDVVYGGVDGYAYVRSLAEFVAPSVYLDVGGDGDVMGGGALPLGVCVARYVEDNLVDAVTRGRHGWLRDVLRPACGDGRALSRFHTRLGALPSGASMKEWQAELLDMAALIRTPEELARESVLEGGGGQGEIERALEWSVGVIEELGRRAGESEGRVKAEEEEEEEEGMDVDLEPDAEEPAMRRLRMNLLALAKRAPLDKIATLPIELVPEHIRGIVPTA